MNLSLKARRLKNALLQPSQAPRRIKQGLCNLVTKKFATRKPSQNGYRRIYNVHIRKCAGTSLNKSIIKALGGGDEFYEDLSCQPSHRLFAGDLPVVGWNPVALNKEAFFYGFSHIPFHQLKFGKDTFTFTFFRDPIQRLVSHFRMLNDLAISQPDHPALKAEKSWACESFDDFLDKIPREHLENQLYMFSNRFNIEEALSKLNDVSYVGHINDIGNDFIPVIEKEFGLSIDYKALRASKHKFLLSDGQQDKCTQMMRAEIEFYNAVCEQFSLFKN